MDTVQAAINLEALTSPVRSVLFLCLSVTLQHNALQESMTMPP